MLENVGADKSDFSLVKTIFGQTLSPVVLSTWKWWAWQLSPQAGIPFRFERKLNFKEFTKMKKQIGMILASLAIVVGLSFVANAQTRSRHMGIEARQAEQQRRINQGIESGQLTPREAARLEAQQARIEQLENRLRSDGDGLSPSERARLQRDLNRASRAIYREKHDRERARTP
jgi:hypothetical protein